MQCFSYDYLGRLTQAWAQGSTGCARTPSASAEGGAAPYWSAYSYNTEGDLTGITSTTPTGAVTTTDRRLPGRRRGAAARHHHAAQVTTVAGLHRARSYGYDASGHLTSVASTAQNEALTWNDAGQLARSRSPRRAARPGTPATSTTPTATCCSPPTPAPPPCTSPDEELSLNTGTGTVTGIRYYSLGGATVAARTGGTTLAYLAGDPQGTDSVAIDASTLGVNRRYYDPYGNPRGTAPAASRTERRASSAAPPTPPPA